MKQNPIYILDYELVSPIATGKHEILDHIKDKKDACGKIENFDVSGLPFQEGAEVKTDLSPFILDSSKAIKDLCKVDRKLELIAAAYGLAAERMKRLMPLLDPLKTGVFLGVGAETIPLELFEADVRTFLDKKMIAVIELISRLNSSGNSVSSMPNH